MPADVDDFFVVSCTGLDIPGLDLRLAGQMGMRADLRRTLQERFAAMLEAGLLAEVTAHLATRAAACIAAGMPAARMGDVTAHGGVIVMGCFTVMFN